MTPTFWIGGIKMLVMQMLLDRYTLLMDRVAMVLGAVTIVLAGGAEALDWCKLL